MNAGHVVVEGTLKADGSLEVAEKLALPPGRVRITIESLASSNAPGADITETFKQIRQAQAARGYRGRTLGEMQADDAAKKANDEEYESRWRAIHGQIPTPLPRERHVNDDLA